MATKRKQVVAPAIELTMTRFCTVAESHGVIVEKVEFFQPAVLMSVTATVEQIDAFAAEFGAKVSSYTHKPNYTHTSGNAVYEAKLYLKVAEAE